MKKKAATKKWVACRFTCKLILKKTVLEYVDEDSYVIDLKDVTDQMNCIP